VTTYLSDRVATLLRDVVRNLGRTGAEALRALGGTALCGLGFIAHGEHCVSVDAGGVELHTLQRLSEANKARSYKVKDISIL